MFVWPAFHSPRHLAADQTTAGCICAAAVGLKDAALKAKCIASNMLLLHSEFGIQHMSALTSTNQVSSASKCCRCGMFGHAAQHHLIGYMSDSFPRTWVYQVASFDSWVASQLQRSKLATPAAAISSSSSSSS
jgi:hypothetical protein